MNSSIQSRIMRILHHNYLVPSVLLKKNKKLSDLGLTEPERLELYLNIENYFGIDIKDEDLNHVNTLGNLLSTVEKYTVKHALISA